MTVDARDLVAEFRTHNVRGLARAITMIERRDPGVRQLIDELGVPPEPPVVIGFTGAPGTGKSTLVDGMVAYLRGLDHAVGVIAVDPNSQFSGGAILGDRIRMQRHALDPRVFIRSMGARGHLGGLSIATREAVRLMGAFGMDHVLVETVGVGQSELEVAAVADTVVLVLTPGLGDSVQLMKAGIIEIADIFVVNKSDLPGADQTARDIRTTLALAPRGDWTPPIVGTIASDQEGVAELYVAIEGHRQYLADTGAASERALSRLKDEAADLVGEWARAQARVILDRDDGLSGRLESDGSPYRTAEEILTRDGARLVPRQP